jgi:parallel beta-helix repeat protein
MKQLTTLAFLVVAGMVKADTWHISTTGNDAADGLTVATAWATIQHGADLAVAGDTVLVHPGSYQGFAAMDHSGTASAPIVFMAGPGVKITGACAYNELDGINVEGVAYVTVEGFAVDGMPRTGIRTALSDHVTIRDNVCNHNGKWGILTGFAENVLVEYNTCSNSVEEHGIYISNSADQPVVRHNRCENNQANGIHMNGDVSMGGDGVISGAQVYGNIIRGNGAGGGSGINCDGVVNSTIWNNLLYGNHASGISLYQIDGGAPSTGNKVWNNTIINAEDARWCINITEDCTGNQLLNNILINQHPWRGSIVVAASALSGFVSDYNVLTGRMSADGDATVLNLEDWRALGLDANSLKAAPQNELFAAVGSDFHAAGAEALQVDAGTSAVAAVVTEDLDGTPRPQGQAMDIGCYENQFATGLAQVKPEASPMMRAEGRVLVVSSADAVRVQVLDLVGRLVLDAGPAAGVRRMPVAITGPGLVRLLNGAGEELAVRRLLFLD